MMPKSERSMIPRAERKAQERAERNVAIRAMRARGFSLTEIAAVHGICSERVRQILKGSSEAAPPPQARVGEAPKAARA